MSMGQNLAKGIPPKMRLIMAATLVIMVIAVVVGVKLFSSSTPVGPEASVKVDAIPEALEGGGSSSAGSAIPEDSPMGQELEKERQKQLNDAQAGKASFMDKFETAHDESRQKKEAQDILDGQSDNVGTGIDDVMAKKRREEERERKLAEMRNYGGESANAYGGYDALMVDDIKRYDERQNEIKAKVGELKTGRASLPVAAPDFGSSSKGQSGEETENQFASRKTSSTLEKFDAADDEESGGDDAATTKPVVRSQRINAGDVYFSILVTPVNSDEVSPIWAIVAQEGKLKNARALGSFQRTGEKVVMQFNNLTVNGRDCAISAVAIDPNPDSYRTAIADSVNRHTFSRYSMLMAAAFVEGYADALSSTTTTVDPSGGSTSQTNPLPDAGDRVLVATGRVGQVLVPKMEKAFERPPTVEVNGRRQLGLLFMSPLDLSSCK